MIRFELPTLGRREDCRDFMSVDHNVFLDLAQTLINITTPPGTDSYFEIRQQNFVTQSPAKLFYSCDAGPPLFPRDTGKETEIARVMAALFPLDHFYGACEPDGTVLTSVLESPREFTAHMAIEGLNHLINHPACQDKPDLIRQIESLLHVPSS